MGDYKLYMHINKINGKRYIGITQQTIARRWRNGGKGYIKSIFFYKAIQKYGWDNFEHQVLEDNLTLEEANKKEIALIKEYNTTNEQFGYNLALGGTNGKHSEETKRKISEIKKLQHIIPKVAFRKGCKPPPLSEEGRERIRQNMIANNPMKRPEIVEKMRKTKKGKHTGKDNSMAKSLVCIETGEIFECLKHATDKYKIAHIGDVCNGKRKNAGGYHWQWLEKEAV